MRWTSNPSGTCDSITSRNFRNSTERWRRCSWPMTQSAIFPLRRQHTLASLSNTPADRKTALAAISHCDLRDLRATDYFLQVHHLAALNEDTTAAAFHVLEQPDFKVVFGAHVLTLGQDYALVYLLLPTEQNYWLGPAITRLGMDRNQTAQQSLLLLLWYAQTDIADKAVRDFSADSAKPTAVRSYAQGLVGRKGNLGPAERAEAPGATQ